MATEKMIRTTGHFQEPFEDMEAFASAVRLMLEQEHPTSDVKIHKVPENNNLMLTGIAIWEKGRNMAETVYLEDFFEEYRNGKPLDEICRTIKEIHQEEKPGMDFDMNGITEFSAVKDKICYKLVNAEKNAARLEGIPHRLWQDLAVVYYISAPLECADGFPSIMVNSRMLRLWGVDEGTLYEHAHRNTPALLNAEITSMTEVLKEIGADLETEIPAGMMDAEGLDSMLPLFVATNGQKINGAAVILYDGFLENFARQTGGDFFILPSSIHEMLFLPVLPDADEHRLLELVRDVNASGTVAPEEILSDHAYRYYAKDNSVRLVS